MKVIEITNLSKIYRDTEIAVNAIDGIDLSIMQGEFTAIVGPSGSGKTTLLNMIGGLDSPTTGTIRINETDVTRLSPAQMIRFRLNNIGFVFQSYNLIPVLTARENVEFIMNLQGISSRQREERTTELLTSVGLGDRMDSRPNKLSGGQQQRVAVARALASRPKFILADEPTANLDSKSAKNLLDIMEVLNHQEKMTFIFSTHDARVMKKAHRIITIEDGRIVSDVINKQAHDKDNNISTDFH
jgi:putative ABC transport system ATP-binding protein